MYPAIWLRTLGVPPCIRALTRCLLFSKSRVNLSGNRLTSSLAVRLTCSVFTLPKRIAPLESLICFCASCCVLF